MSNLGNIYQHHHLSGHRDGVSVMKEERGEFLRQTIGINREILDIGCRDGTLTAYFVAGNKVRGIDIDESALKRAGDRLKIKTSLVDLNGNWEELGTARFDVVVAGEVLEHLYFPNLVAKKVSHRLRPNGLFIGSVPNAFSLRHRLRYLFGRKKYTPLSDPTHINQFNSDELHQLLQEYFESVEIYGLGRFKWLARNWPGLFAFDLMWVARRPIVQAVL